jgi:hypothetical protein
MQVCVICWGTEHTAAIVAFVLSCRHFITEQYKSTGMQLIDRRLMKRCVAELTSKVRHNIGGARFYMEQDPASPGLRLRLCKYRGKRTVGVYEYVRFPYIGINRLASCCDDAAV